MVFFFLPKNSACDAQSRGSEAGYKLTPIIRASSCPVDYVNIQILHSGILVVLFTSSFAKERTILW